MFGYVNIQKDKLTEGERGLYQTFMCGLCMSTKKFFPDIARMTVNYILLSTIPARGKPNHGFSWKNFSWMQRKIICYTGEDALQ